MIVDWLRACYESDFCVNTDTGETIRGRYYWAAPEAKVYPAPHSFGSAVWLDPHERGGLTYLGDQFTNVTKDDGEAPAVRPLSQRFEKNFKKNCNAAPSIAFEMTDDTYLGLPRYCYRVPLDEAAPYVTFLDPHEQSTQCFFAQVVRQLYEAFGGVGDTIADNVPGVEAVDTQLDGSGLEPQWVMWKSKFGRGIVFAGTANYQQFCLQAWYGSDGPQPRGPFYTNPFWWEWSQNMRAAFDAFAGPHKGRTFVAGHSYGGAVAGLLAASETKTYNRDEYTLLTYGAPRLGNGEVYRSLSADMSVFVQNENDFIPSLPPSYPTLSDLLPILGPRRYFGWQRWAPPPTCLVYRADGTSFESNAWNAPDYIPAALATIFATGAIMPAVVPHEMDTYALRICGT